MARWEPDPQGRLQRAALDLFAERGFAATTVPEITARAGLTTRTFFRHFADKREVLFSGADELRLRLAEIMRSAPEGLSPLELIRYSLEAGADELFGPRFDDVRAWRAVVASDEALQERALRKQRGTMEAAAVMLQERGIDQATAEVMGELAVMLLERAVGRWVEQPVERRPLNGYVREALDGLTAALSS